MIPPIYLQRQAQAEALINAERTSILASAVSIIEKGDLALTSICIHAIEILRAKLDTLFEENADCTKIALKTLYMTDIFPLLRQKMLKETTQKILSLNTGMLVTALGLPPINEEEEEMDPTVYENYNKQFTLLKTQLHNIKNGDHQAITAVFREITYSQYGVDPDQSHQQPKPLKRTIAQIPRIDHLINLFTNDLYDSSFETDQASDDGANAVIHSSSCDETEANAGSDTDSYDSTDLNLHDRVAKRLKQTTKNLQD